jgi:hypothetical protein
MKQAHPQTISQAVSGAVPQTPPQLPPPGALESFFIFISLMLVTQALGPLLMAGSSGDDALGGFQSRDLAVGAAGLHHRLFPAGRRPGVAMETIRDNPLLLTVFLFPMLSVIWSVDHGTSFRRCVALLMTGIYCVYIARRLSPDEFLRRLLLALFVGGVLSLIFTLVDPRRPSSIAQSTTAHGKAFTATRRSWAASRRWLSPCRSMSARASSGSR